MDTHTSETSPLDITNHVDPQHCNVAMVATLRVRGERRLTLADSLYAHAGILQAITDADPAAGRELHDGERHKPFSLALIPDRQGAARLRLGFLDIAGLHYLHLLLNKLRTYAVGCLCGIMQR